MSGSTGRTLYQLGYEISPIILVGGIAEASFGILPIVALTEGPNALSSILSGKNPFNLDNFFAHFAPVPGSTLVNYNIGTYPFANQSVAANAIIAEPLTISMRMNIPVNRRGGHTAKLATMTILQTLLQQHAELGGLYTILTPAAIYTSCILTRLTDVSSGDSPIPQNAYQFDFIKPLVTLQAAYGAQSSLINRVARALVTNGSWAATATANFAPSVSAGAGIAATNIAPGSLPPPVPIIGS
jgi:hypothetical protein